VRQEFGKDVLATTGELRRRVNQHLGREDLTSETLRGAGSSDVRESLRAGSLEVAAGSGKLLRYAEVVSAAGVKGLREEPDEAVIEKIQRDGVEKCVTPDLALLALPEPVVQMGKAMPMDCSGASFLRSGWWFGGQATSPRSTWMIGLA
jgi:hypothetical protein